VQFTFDSYQNAGFLNFSVHLSMMYGLVITLLISVVFMVLYRLQSAQFKKKRLADIRDRWAKPAASVRNTRSIEKYMKLFGEDGHLSAAISNDLDLDEVFAYIDRTSSRPGQQYLYKQLHSPQTDPAYCLALEERIVHLTSDKTRREQIQLQLSELNSNNACYLPELFSKAHQSLFSPLLKFYVNISAVVVVVLIGLLVFVPNTICFVLLIAMLMLNTGVHYSSKHKIMGFTHSLPQLLVLYKVSRWLAVNDCFTDSDDVKDSMQHLRKIKRSLGFVNFQNRVNADPTDILYLLTEWLKMFLLIEPLVFNFFISRVNRYLSHIHKVYVAVAEVDMAIAIQSVREGLPYYSKPVFNAGDNRIEVEELYHPLIENCVANSIDCNNSQGVLITGSNMSGKTTFIRAMAVNTLLSQTINTSCTRVYKAPLLKLFTSIHMADDLNQHKSYFQVEALSVLNIINHCRKEEPVKSLVFIDEIFRGTNTIERIAGAKAVLAYLVANQNFVFISTHDLELAGLLGNGFAVYSFEEHLGDDRLVFDYKIKEGLLKNQNGIAVLEGMGYPQSVITEAKQVSRQLRDKYDL
jgi:hypothetical protein